MKQPLREGYDLEMPLQRTISLSECAATEIDDAYIAPISQALRRSGSQASLLDEF